MAAENSTISSNDNAWMLTSTGFVYMLTPALAFFYGGLVDSKNILNQLFLSFICIAIVTCQWCLIGFSFVFGPGNSAFGSFQYSEYSTEKTSTLRFTVESPHFFGLEPDDTNSETFPLMTFVAYQGAVAVFAPAMISGAVVGRMKLIPYMIFIFLWTTFCYDPLTRWSMYSKGWLKVYSSLDFGGGDSVHIASGVSGLVAAMILGKRHDYDPMKHFPSHNLPLTVLGTGFLWVGWTGYIGGSALAANGYASLAITNANISAASALLAWVLMDAIRGSISICGACSGLLVGLVVITPGAGYIQPGYCLLIGIIGSVCVYWWVQCKKHFLHIDDTLDTFSCHGIGAIIGSFCTGLFAQTDVNPSGYNGAFYGNPIQIWRQLAGILTSIGFSAACTIAILLPMQLIFGIRFKPEDQIIGMDILGHGQTWNVQNLSSNSEAVMVTDAPPLVTQPPVRLMQHRMSVRDVLQDAFT